MALQGWLGGPTPTVDFSFKEFSSRGTTTTRISATSVRPAGFKIKG
jgi:hypothetical protein